MRILLVSLHHVEYAIELAEAIGNYHSVHLVLRKQRVKHTVGETAINSLEPNVGCSLLSYRTLRHPSIVNVILEIFRIVFWYKPDVIHIQECYNPLNTIYFLLRSFSIVVTVHDVVIHPGKQRRLIPRWKVYLTNIIRKYGYRKIIVHGQALKKQYLDTYQGNAADIFVIPHGCLFSFQQSGVNKVNEESHTVLIFGRIQEYKGLRYLIEAEPYVSDAVPDLKIIVAGEGDELTKYKPLMLSNSHYEIHDRFIQNAEVAEYFKRASVIILPYIEASQSGIVAMAFAFGKPVIVTDVGSLAEMVQDGYSGIVVPPGDSLTLAEAMITLLSDSSKRRRLARCAHMVSQTELAWDNVARLTVDAYRNTKPFKPTKPRNRRIGENV